MIIQDRQNRFYHAVKAAFDASGAVLDHRVEVRQFATACLLAEQEVGIAIVSSIDAAEYVGRGLVTRPFEPQLPFRLDILYPKYHPRSLLMQEFIAQFRESLTPFILAD